MRNYWKSHDFLELSDELIDVIVKSIPTIPNGHTEIFLPHMGGATSRVPADATAYFHRDAQYIMNIHGRWENPDDDEALVSWCRELFYAATPFATGGVYVNFMTGEEGDRVQRAYGDSYGRLVELKKKYDPTNLFHFNQNIRPSA
jgi:hypothetical protein